MPDRPHISILIPILNEAEHLHRSLADLYRKPWVSRNCEVIVCDGGSDDGSPEIAAGFPCRVVKSRRGRALQMNASSRQARGDYLLFLHADSRISDEFDGRIEPGLQWGYFRSRLSGAGLAFRIIETAINLRTRLSRVAGGDQGLVFERQFFESLGGFPEIPLMEDISICKQARQLARPVIFKSAITTSSRRWQTRGIVKTILLMWWLRMAYWLGVDPERLYKTYYQGG